MLEIKNLTVKIADEAVSVIPEPVSFEAYTVRDSSGSTPMNGPPRRLATASVQFVFVMRVIL